MYPGFGPPSLFTFTGGPTSYPITYDQKQACNNIVYSTELVDSSSISYGKVFVWKDYGDVLYVTVSLYASGWGAEAKSPFSPGLYGQYLFSQPSQTNGQIFLWSGLPNGVTNYYISDLVSSGFAWSCFTVQINTKSVCNPYNSNVYQRCAHASFM